MSQVFSAFEKKHLKTRWWELWPTKLFGKKTVFLDSGYMITIYHWRGKKLFIEHKALLSHGEGLVRDLRDDVPILK